MSNIKISVIMPVYNVAKYLEECLDSVLNQTLQSIELIAVDDCSVDGSFEILQKYAASDKRMTVVRNPYNIGAARSRNIGIQLARGKYVAILDSDDFFEPDFLESMFNMAESTNSDLVLCNVCWHDSNTLKDSVYPLPEFALKKLQSPFNAKDIADRIFSTFLVVPFNKLILRSMLTESMLEFQDIPNSNDVFFGEAVLIYAKKISYVDKAFIHYRAYRKDSISSRRHKDWIYGYKSCKKLYDLICANPNFAQFQFSLRNLALIVMGISASDLYDNASKEELQKFLSFWQEEGFPSLGMTNLSDKDFLNKEYFLQWKMVSDERKFYPQIPKIFLRDVYEEFFEELLLRNLNVALWGYGKEGTYFLQMADACNFSIFEVYDRDKNKHQEGAISVKSFMERNHGVNAIVSTNTMFAREIAEEVWSQDKSVRVFDFDAFFRYGATFKECEVVRRAYG